MLGRFGFSQQHERKILQLQGFRDAAVDLVKASYLTFGGQLQPCEFAFYLRFEE